MNASETNATEAQVATQDGKDGRVVGEVGETLCWTVGVNKKVMKDMRLHLTWVLNGEVFHWTDKQIGTRMLRVFHTLTRTSRSTFVNHVLL